MADEAMISLERRDDGVAVITLNNPKVNALCGQLTSELLEAVHDLHNELPGAVVVTGGPKIFAAGAEISEFGGPAEARVIGQELGRALVLLSNIPRAVIAAVSGYALGGGCELSMACDFRIASERAVFGQPEILLGIIPGGGGTQRLPRLVGPSIAKDICMSGRQVDAEEAFRIGLVNEVVPHDQCEARALELAADYAKGALVAQGLTKHAIDAGIETTVLAGLHIEYDNFVEVFESDDSQIGVKSFLENGPGKAQFTGK